MSTCVNTAGMSEPSDARSNPTTKRRHQRRAGWSWLWLAQAISLLGLAIWAALDPLFSKVSRLSAWQTWQVGLNHWRVPLLVLIAALAIGSLLLLLVRFLARSNQRMRSRSLAQLLAITTLAAAWCGMLIHLDSIAWQGKRIRFVARVDQLEAIAAPLRTDWPQQDGEVSQVGPFMAYPFGRPKTLVLLQAPRVTERAVYVSSIERGDDGSIKLQLTGTDGGDWAEWHPEGSRPKSFVDGLFELHRLDFATPIGRGWYLVRYQSGPR
ncbi:hypothetical protein [Rhodopirellula halodulae]|uniref:hypothetical protein n=1 Tax=Rhodopirellula halodulae TaxID=2894198 RepID=UPI001E3650C3|nr:hypothetical protein [Rhodopirellula sp. JC737]MCC9656184.1 hypothetical protein [Rhodopirellula sp. JC737]